jgi:hypothetical protein
MSMSWPRAGAAGVGDEPGRPLYVRLLRLRYLKPSATLCFVFLEGATALGVLLALAELVDWWGVVILPACIAAMVKINDVVAGAVVRSTERTVADRPRRVRQPPRPVVGRAAVPGSPATDKTGRVYRSSTETAATAMGMQPAGVDFADMPSQRARQAATRRYE